MSTKTNERARIAGAIAALEALRKLEHAATSADQDQTPAEFYAQRLSDAREFVTALGPMTPEVEGAISVIAEYIHMSITTGTPNLEPGGWLPMSAMTEGERRAKIEAKEPA